MEGRELYKPGVLTLRICPQTVGAATIPCEIEPYDNNDNLSDCYNYPRS